MPRRNARFRGARELVFINPPASALPLRRMVDPDICRSRPPNGDLGSVGMPPISEPCWGKRGSARWALTPLFGFREEVPFCRPSITPAECCEITVFTAIAVCSPVIGISATASMCGVADAMLPRPLPVREPDRVLAMNTAVSVQSGQNPPRRARPSAPHRRTTCGLTAR
jgi:hypothetical protein